VASSAPRPLPPAPAEAACRALRAEGQIRVRGSERAVTAGQSLDGRTWLELGKGAKLSLRHSRSARELELTGPATVLPFALGEEQVLLAEGTLQSSRGPGARPGAEVLVATPLGSVRYADAALEIRALGRRLEVRVRSGTARINPAEGAIQRDKLGFGPKSKAVVVGNLRPEALVLACESSATDAEALARKVGAGDGGKLGQRAAAHVEARRKARSTCATATAASALAAEPERSKLFARVAAADRRWRAIPHPAKGLQK
jgi:hypothetical protein